MINTILFDLDGTLLPMDQDVFTKTYFSNLARSLAAYHQPEELINAVWAGTKAMIMNDGSRTNEAAFWEKYARIFGPDARKEEPVFAKFYETKFRLAADKCGENPEIPPLVTALKRSGYKLGLATNPLFPEIAQLQRIVWAGLDPRDFACITTYENSRFCKPNPEYYREVLRKIGADPADTLMVGNDVREDMEAAAAAGIRGFLLTDCLLNPDGRDISQYPHGDAAALRDFIASVGFCPLES